MKESEQIAAELEAAKSLAKTTHRRILELEEELRRANEDLRALIGGWGREGRIDELKAKHAAAVSLEADEDQQSVRVVSSYGVNHGEGKRWVVSSITPKRIRIRHAGSERIVVIPRSTGTNGFVSIHPDDLAEINAGRWPMPERNK